MVLNTDIGSWSALGVGASPVFIVPDSSEQLSMHYFVKSRVV